MDDVLGETPLMIAARSSAYPVGSSSKKHECILQTLINLGAELNAINNRGETALMIAAGFGNGHSVRCLIVNSADVSFVDKRGDDALKHAAKSGHTGIAAILTPTPPRSKASMAISYKPILIHRDRPEHKGRVWNSF